MKNKYFMLFFLCLALFCAIGYILNLPIFLAKIAGGLAIIGSFVYIFLLATNRIIK